MKKSEVKADATAKSKLFEIKKLYARNAETMEIMKHILQPPKALWQMFLPRLKFFHR
jgi:hypothetical protein